LLWVCRVGLYAVPLLVIAVILAVAPTYFEPYLHWPGAAVGVGVVVLYVMATRNVIRMTRSRRARRRLSAYGFRWLWQDFRRERSLRIL
jgi:hypothetical protein